MKITNCVIGDKVVVSLEGSMDIETVDELENMTLPPSVTQVSIDFEGVAFIDSTGIGWLLHFVQSLQKEYEKVCIVHTSEEIREVFDIVQFSDIVGDEVLP